jgi:hypothetical protein
MLYYVIVTCKPLLFYFYFLFLFFLFLKKIYQNMGQKLGSNTGIKTKGVLVLMTWILLVFDKIMW